MGGAGGRCPRDGLGIVALFPGPRKGVHENYCISILNFDASLYHWIGASLCGLCGVGMHIGL